MTDAGADAVVVTAPFYTRTHPAEIARHFRLDRRRSPVPVFAYDLPVAVHTKLGADLVLELAAEGVLAGLKDSSGDQGGFRRVVTGARARARHQRVQRADGVRARRRLRRWRWGRTGRCRGSPTWTRRGMCGLYRLCREGDWERARAEQERLCALFGMVRVGDPGRMGGSSSAIGAFKAALQLRGVIACAATAEPQVPLSADEVERVGKFLAGAGLL